MTPETAEAPAPTKTRRSPAALEAHYLALAAEAKAKQELKIKKALEKLATEVQAIAVQRTSDPKIGQAASLLNTAAAAIQVKLPQ
jgi:hypothetical protein